MTISGCRRNTRRSFHLLGARPGVAEEVRDWISRNCPETEVAGCHHVYFTPDQEEEVIRNIAESGADVLLASMGVPVPTSPPVLIPCAILHCP